jgi:phosphodiesterase/alkaline phosphatase D-like protein
LAGLASGTTYFYRAKIDGGVYGSVFGVEKSFTAGSTPLTILTDTPTSIAPASATLNGILTSLGGVPNALVSFQWGSAAGVYPFETTQRSKSTGGTFTDNISGLTSGSLYFYRAKVDDGVNGGAFGAERSFRAGATCPTGTTQTATAIGTGTVTLNGNLLTLGSATPTVDVMFQWGTASTHYVNETTPQPISSGAPFAAGLSGLANGTTYYYRAKIDGGVNGSVFGVEKSFTAGKTNPVVTTDGVTTITPTTGTLNGILMSLGTSDNASVSFQWGTAGGVYPYETPLQNQTRPIAFTTGLTGLTDNVTYYYRARVDDGTSGGAFGLERTFRAGATCPTATTQTATGITATTAILQGNLLTRGSASVVDACFQWGTTPLGYVNQTPLQAMDSGAPFLATLTGLVDGTRYYYRAHVDGGSNGMCLGVEKSFIAGRNPPVVLTDTPTAITPSSVTLNGIMTTLGTAPGALVSFQWGANTGVYPDETPQQDYNAAGTFTDNLTGLSDNVTYYYRAKADDGVSGGAFGVERAFRAGTTCPIASTEPATEVSTNTALLHANLTSLGSATSCNITFEWGSVSTVYPSETALITRTALGIVSCNLTGLAPDTQYFFRAKADGGLNGSALGLEKNFFTGRTPPTVTTDLAYVTTTTATLRGNLTSLGSAPSCNMTFEWGSTPGIYLFETPIQTENVTGGYQADITGLNPNTNYYFRGKADGGTHGGAFSAERTLLTAGATSRASGTTPAGGTAIVEFSSSAGNLSGLTATAASSLPCTFPMVHFPFGVFSFTISNLTPGGSAVVTLGLPESISSSAMYYKCQNGRLVDCTSLLGHNNGDNTLTLTLTDGGLGDADGQRNGTIVDPGGPVLRDPMNSTSQQGSSPMISTSPPSQMPANNDGVTPQSTVDRGKAAPMTLANIVVISAELERHDAAAGEPVKVTAMVSNKGGTGGTAKIMVTVNGYETDARGITVEKGGAVPVEFYVSGDSPGQYQVYVNNVSAGEFYVSPFRLSDLILWFSTACVLAALMLGALYILRRRRDGH